MRLSYLILAIAILPFVSCSSQHKTTSDIESTVVPKEERVEKVFLSAETLDGNYEIAYFSSGCFWCVEAIYESIEGIPEVISGYAGGKEENADYSKVSAGITKHVESVKIYYDPEIVSYETLVRVFFGSGDPTTPDQQGPDKGYQYRSEIIFQSKEEQQIAKEILRELDKSGEFGASIVTEIKPLVSFYAAEEYHQDYERLNPNQGYVRSVSIPRLNRFKANFPNLLKGRNTSDDATTSEDDKVVMTEKEWKEFLDDEQYFILREKGTERAFTGKYWDHKDDGIYSCAACQNPLFDSKTKFKSGTGWPSYFAPIREEAILELDDFKYGSKRTEVLCSRCEGHLGHVFNDGPKPTGLRYCLNSASMQFSERDQ